MSSYSLSLIRALKASNQTDILRGYHPYIAHNPIAWSRFPLSLRIDIGTDQATRGPLEQEQDGHYFDTKRLEYNVSESHGPFPFTNAGLVI
jgi:hypothetical protein